MSVVLFPPAHLAPAARAPAFGCAWLTALGSVAVAEVVAAATGRAASIKWPNDVRVNGRKIAGILVERALAPSTGGRDLHAAADLDLSPRGVVVGIGLNVNLAPTDLPPELEHRTTSLFMECGGPLDRSDLVRELIRRLDHWYDAGRSGGASTLNRPWRALSEHLGTMIRVVTPATTIAGRLIDLDFDAGLTLFVESALISQGQSPRGVRIPLADVLELQPAE
jgi:BirA family biotin operon repressor/biotin-[acetyl-CoA-carboxylase] ligase